MKPEHSARRTRADDSSADRDLDETHSEVTATAPSEPTKHRQIGPFKLLQQIGKGGMGSVWMAEQRKPIRRRVALKIIRADLGGDDSIARFEAEMQALAMMDHQNIAKVLDAGTTEDGTPYFVMEYVKGIPFTKYCDQKKLSIQERLKLLLPVCAAVQHAHQKGIMHRDIKPSNVLVTHYDDVAVPKVIDFGLAKAMEHSATLTDKTMFTEFGKIVGTIHYMSPEQAQIDALDVDTRTDVYSLGVMLYEQLTGTTPLATEGSETRPLLETLKTIREVEPEKPSVRFAGVDRATVSELRETSPLKHRQILKGELDWVVMKALEINRSKRYQTANELGQELTRFLDGEPVEARPASILFGSRKARKRFFRIVAVSGWVAALLLPLIVFGFSWIATSQLRDENRMLASVAEQSQQEIRRAQQTVKDLKAEADLAAQLAAREKALANVAKQEVMSASEAAKEANQRAAIAAEQREEMEQSVQRAMKELASAQEETQIAKKQLDQATYEAAELEKERMQYSVESAQLKKELEAAQQKVKEASEQLRIAEMQKKEAEQLTSKIVDAAAEIEKLRKKSAKDEKRIKELLEQLKEKDN